MSTQIDPTAAETPPANGGTTPQPLPPSPTKTRYQQIADQFLTMFKAAVAIIPNLESPHSSTSNFVRSHVNAPLKFLGTVTKAVEENPELHALGKLDVDSAYDRLQYIEAFRRVIDPVAVFLRSLGFTVSSQQATLSADALQVYDISKGIARDPGSAHIAAWVERMRQALGKPGRPKKAASGGPSKQQPVPTSPAPPGVPTPKAG